MSLDLDEDEELMEDPEEEGYPCGGQGVRERTLLCPIQEEDTESTASGSSVSVANNQSNKRSTVINNNNNVNNSNNSTLPTTPDTIEDTQEVIQEEVHDGHYFIKVKYFLNFPNFLSSRVAQELLELDICVVVVIVITAAGLVCKHNA